MERKKCQKNIVLNNKKKKSIKSHCENHVGFHCLRTVHLKQVENHSLIILKLVVDKRVQSTEIFVEG